MASYTDVEIGNFEFHQSNSNRQNQMRQYCIYLNAGGTMTFPEFLFDGRYDPSDWGPSFTADENGMVSIPLDLTTGTITYG